MREAYVRRCGPHPGCSDHMEKKKPAKKQPSFSTQLRILPSDHAASSRSVQPADPFPLRKKHQQISFRASLLPNH